MSIPTCPDVDSVAFSQNNCSLLLPSLLLQIPLQQPPTILLPSRRMDTKKELLVGIRRPW